MLLDSKQPFRAGDWTVDPELNALLRDGQEHRVEPKVMQVLVMLASRQNHVFSKAELIAAVWPDTFVGEDVLTRCISILRRITADSYQAPRFIQTVPRVGYRLVAPVGALQSSPLFPETAAPGNTPLQRPASETSHFPDSAGAAAPHAKVLGSMVREPVRETQVEERKPARQLPPWTRVMAGLVLLLVLILPTRFALRSLTTQPNAGRPAPQSAHLTILPFTSDAGEQSQPAFAPDGQSIALVRKAEDGNLRRLCIKRIGEETCRPLSTLPGEEFSPAWSPSGRDIAFLNRDGDSNGLYIVTLDGKGLPRRVYAPEEPSQWDQGALSWSPDGRSLVFPDHQRSSPYSVILRLDLASSTVEPITAPPPGWEGDLNPVYSPDGTRIAFTRASETAVRDLYWLSVRDGSVHQLTHERADINGITWTRDGSGLIYSTNSGGQYALWRAGLDGTSATPLPVGTENATQPAAGPLPGQLVYTQGSAVWGIDLVGFGTVLTSTQEDSAPSLSPDGGWFAFQSRRSGAQQIWISSLHGDSLRQLTSTSGPMAGSPSWSHAGNLILFDARPQTHSHIFCIPATGGPARQLTFGDFNDIVPRWSNDDRSVYFRSNRGGGWRLWRMDLNSGKVLQVTQGDGMAAQESADGTALFFTRGYDAGLWRKDLLHGGESQVSADPPAGYWGYMQATKAGVLILRTAGKATELALVNDRNGQAHTVTSLKRMPPKYQGLSVSPDLKQILVTEKREAEQHVTLVNGLPKS